jgi:hypothetical protein
MLARSVDIAPAARWSAVRSPPTGGSDGKMNASFEEYIKAVREDARILTEEALTITENMHSQTEAAKERVRLSVERIEALRRSWAEKK